MAEGESPEEEIPKERETSPRGSRLFQIYEDDLALLEKAIPAISEFLMGRDNPLIRTQLRRIKDIVSDVRWNYGPHGQVTIIPAEDIPPAEGEGDGVPS